MALAGVEWKWHLRLAEEWWDGWDEMNRIMSAEAAVVVPGPRRRSIIDATTLPNFATVFAQGSPGGSAV